jgi:hypothetical protein
MWKQTVLISLNLVHRPLFGRTAKSFILYVQSPNIGTSRHEVGVITACPRCSVSLLQFSAHCGNSSTCSSPYTAFNVDRINAGHEYETCDAQHTYNTYVVRHRCLRGHIIRCQIQSECLWASSEVASVTRFWRHRNGNVSVCYKVYRMRTFISLVSYWEAT